ncbi:putative pyridoxal kinase BUD16 SCDLUD_003388 [Saccharomycodes ludwigii]|uniref:putative pyridoxal kinase BUD16 n=1 Tax=Saccharomycodes ludwigii TaxID=36035 RepID=UPI001E84067C|nr:hypothetical protein SCDLUD_003388 [Saccharomycodes ludwigii]KAH3900409.1 hypothetical protein SCDLUD_003388 [Saccharomycodes ludwigii]
MPTLLSTQSHVVHGYVGNKAAAFPLQCLGWDVDCLNTVQFSNHTGYGKVVGDITPVDELLKITNHLLQNFKYNSFLTGYLPNKDSVEVICDNILNYKKNTKSNSSTIRPLWLLDPVMGDDGHIYVDPNVIPTYQKYVLSGYVDIITPNQFELQLLTNTEGKVLNTTDDLRSLIVTLHQKVPIIVITSTTTYNNNHKEDDKNKITCIASIRNNNGKLYKFQVPKINSYFTGVGDLFSAILLDRMWKLKYQNATADMLVKDFIKSINYVLNVIQKVLQTTIENRSQYIKTLLDQQGGEGAAKIGGDAKIMAEMELKIIESKDHYDNKENLIDYFVDVI